MLEDNLKTEVNHLLEMKMKSKETEYIPVVDHLNQYIEENINKIKNYANSIAEIKIEWNKLNQYFLILLKINVKNDIISK